MAKAEKPAKKDTPAKTKASSSRVAKSEKSAKEKGTETVAQKTPRPQRSGKSSGAVKQDAPPSPGGAQAVTHSVITGPTVIQRQRPKEKTPLLIGGGLVLAGGGALYALSYQGKLGLAERARSQSEKDLFGSDKSLNDEIGKVNTLYLSAVAAIAVGSGSLTWGIMVDQGVTMPRIGMKF